MHKSVEYKSMKKTDTASLLPPQLLWVEGKKLPQLTEYYFSTIEKSYIYDILF